MQNVVQKTEELLLRTNFHLEQLKNITNELRDLRDVLLQLKNSKENEYLWELLKIKEHTLFIKSELERRGLPSVNEYELLFDSLEKSLKSDEWPIAVKPEEICLTEEDALRRACWILDILIIENVEGKRFLDYGCGQGHVVAEVKKRDAAFAIGYDVDLSQCKADASLVVADFDEVKKNSPFDIILVHDVLDSIIAIDPVQALAEMKGVLSPGGRIYVKNHPWSSRHGGDLYKKINKAFIHLIFDESELMRIGNHQLSYNLRITRPISTYRDWFSRAGLKIKSEIPITQSVDEFFLRPSVQYDRLLRNWRPEEMVENMQVRFVEYILESDSSYEAL